MNTHDTAHAVDAMSSAELLEGLEGLAPPEEQVEDHSDEHWYPRAFLDRTEQKWPPVPTAESLSYWFYEAVRAGSKYLDEIRYRRIIDTAAYCLDRVPADIAENVLFNLYVSSGRRADPEKWTGTFNELAAVLWRPPVREHEVRMTLLKMMKEAA